MNIPGQLPINISLFEDLEAYKQVKFARSTLIDAEKGVYAIEKIKFTINPEALKEIQRLLQSGDIWIATGKTELAAVGMEDKHVKQILKKKVVNGEEVYKDITNKKTVRELTPEEMDEISIVIEHTLDSLKMQKAEKQSPSSSPKTEAGRLARRPETLTETTSKAEKKGKPELTQAQKEYFALRAESQLERLQRSKQKKKEREKQAEEKDEKSRILKEEQKKWDEKTRATKTENIAHHEKMRQHKKQDIR